MRYYQKSFSKPKIDMIPIMDSIFLLLVFFVYSMTFMHVLQGIPLQLPLASTKNSVESDYLTISVDKDGGYWLGKEKILLEKLILKLSTYDKEKQVLIRADGSAKHAWVLAVLDVLRKEGLTNVSFQTESKS